jgi:hypothetical protein
MMMMMMMMRKLFSFEQEKKERYNVDFSDLHIINICNEENEKDSVKKNKY